MTTTATPAFRHAVQPKGGNPLTGTGSLLRFGLRRDRVRTPVWLAALTLGTVWPATAFSELYANEAERQTAGNTMNTPAGLAFTGPEHYLTDYHYGAMLGHQMLGFVAILVGLMSVLMVVRHTRAEEETGRAEQVRANVVGRHAHLVSAVLVVAAANVLIGFLTGVGIAGLGIESMDWSGSMLYGAAHTAAGLAFTGAAAVTVQITEHSRGAAGLGMAVVGVAYVLRASGDVNDSGLSWASPIGWSQATWAFLENRWWPLLLSLALASALTVLGFGLSTRRDVGAGLRQARPGARQASNLLVRPIGLALRLHRGMMLGFGIAMLLLGVAYGSVLGDAESMLGSIDVFQDAMANIGGTSVAESFASLVPIVMAILASVYVVLAMSRPRAEETAGRAEPMLALPLSRSAWLASHLVVALIGSVVMMLAAGIGFGASGAAAISDGSMFGKLVWACLAYTPALWLVAGVAVALFGFATRAVALAWILPLYGFVVGYLGQLLQFPGWLSNLSPFGHIPQLPAREFTATPLLLLTAIAAVLIAAGLTMFREREITTV